MSVLRCAALLTCLLVAFSCADLANVELTCGADGKIESYVTDLVGYVRSGDNRDLYFLGDDHKHIYAMTSESILYHSTNEGQSWSNEMGKLDGSDVVRVPEQKAGVRQIILTASENQTWFLGYGGYLWTTNDKGAHYKHHVLQFNFTSLKPHPYISNWALIQSATPECYRGSSAGSCIEDLYVTRDFGESWELVAHGALIYQWGVDGLVIGPLLTNSTIVYTASMPVVDIRRMNPYNINLYSTTDFGRTQKLLHEHTAGLLLHGGVFFIAVITSRNLAAIELQVSQDGGMHFVKCVFPHEPNLKENSYIILDTSEGAAFVAVDHTPSERANVRWASVYVSDGWDVDFTLSVKYVKIAFNWETSRWQVDFSKVKGIDGVYIANVYWEPYSGEEPSPDRDSSIHSLITFNKGGDWEDIPPPLGTSCPTRDCWLHLNGPSTSAPGRVYSDEDAVGLVLATGNVGEALTTIGAQDTFFSRDAGLTWTKVADGANLYEFADHGGLTVLAALNNPSPNISYSWRQGRQWEVCQFANAAIQVDDIYVDSRLESKSIVVVGQKRVGGTSTGIIAQISFTEMAQRVCQGVDRPGDDDSDYELFTPGDAVGSDCLMGHTTSYVRRKADAMCFNPELFETTESSISCPCRRTDYECDTCYVEQRNGTDLLCVFDPTCTRTDIPDPSRVCLISDQDYYYEINGYRIVPGNECDLDLDGSVNLLGELKFCKEQGAAGGVGSFVTLVLVAIGVLVLLMGSCIFLLRTNDSFYEFWARTVPGMLAPRFGRGSGSGAGSNAVYSQLGRPDTMEDDEELGGEAKELDDDTISNYNKKPKKADSKPRDQDDAEDI